ncbi:glycoside hydrolase family 10 protein [Gillisia sp. JM1]|uniref:glycoside hydrolase family 10 protein n=1 Tax=Gillisia sp. JM1 TaxID=1283286 RepID=UPI0003FABF5D|nr:family 10 glycosylhydrolase [Gillisia sp. JM1]
MRRNKIILALLFVSLTLLSACSAKKAVTKTPEKPKHEVPEVLNKNVPERPIHSVEIIEKPEIEEPIAELKDRKGPTAMREFRAAWVATVANINWPSKSGLSTAQQQKEALALLDYLKDHNFNAVIFQARPQADALYKSDLEPWSFFLSGEQGKAPDPYYDPLEFWVNEAHNRGMELHVWLNPYRAHHSTGGVVGPKSTVKMHPEFMVSLKNGMWWMDPSKQTTQDHSAAVVMDIVKRYDIDGIHFDDYFYPYASYNKGQDFPDSESYQAYLKTGGKLTKPDWRRDEVNGFVERIYKDIKAEKPEVKFGISPFGIWRPGFPKSISGLDQYNELYADAKLWLNKGWIDYFTPQLYWKINQTAQSFPVLLGWWESENTEKRHLWPGINIDFGGDTKNVDETINQIMLTRGMLPDSKGAVHWSIGSLLKYPIISKGLIDGPYKNEALIPASPWLNKKSPAAPKTQIISEGGKINIAWEKADTQEISNWVVYYKYASSWEYKILSGKETNLDIDKLLIENGKKIPLLAVGVTAVGRTGNESDFKEIKL